MVTTNTKSYQQKDKKDLENIFNSMEQTITKVLQFLTASVKELVQVVEQPVYMDWLRFREEFYKYTTGEGPHNKPDIDEGPHNKPDIDEGPHNKPDIIFIRATERLPPSGMSIQHIIRCLKKNYIVITNAMSIRGPVSPLAFPGNSVIAVGRKGEKVHGSTLDFVIKPCKQIIRSRSNKDAEENTEKDVINKVVEEKDVKDNILKEEDAEDKVFEEHEEEKVLHAKETDALIKNVKDKVAEAEKNQPWEASLEAVGIAAVILLKAQCLSK